MAYLSDDILKDNSGALILSILTNDSPALTDPFTCCFSTVTFLVQWVTMTALAVSIANCFLIFSLFNFLNIITTMIAATKNIAPMTAVKIFINQVCLPWSKASVTGKAEIIIEELMLERWGSKKTNFIFLSVTRGKRKCVHCSQWDNS